MGIPVPNTVIRSSKDGRFARVTVGGVFMAGVVDVSIARDVVERANADGWVERRHDGDPYVVIKVKRRFVQFSDPEPNKADA